MRIWLMLTLLAFGLASDGLAAELPKPLIRGLSNPESVAVGPDRQMYVSIVGGTVDGDGSIARIENGKATTFVSGLNDPKGIAFFQKYLFVTDVTRVLRIDVTAATPKAEVWADADAFPKPPKFLNDVTIDAESGTVFVSDSGDLKGSDGAVYRLTPPMAPKGQAPTGKPKIDLVLDSGKLKELHTPNGLTMDGRSSLLLVDFGSGVLYRIDLNSGNVEKLADGMEGGDGLTWNHHGQLYVSSWKSGKVWGIPRPGMKPILMAEGLKSAADTCLDVTGRLLLVPDMVNGDLYALPAQIPGYEIQYEPLPLKTEVAFPNLKWTGWESETADGRLNPLRPIVLTHFGDGSNQIVVATQHGVVHTFPNDQAATETKILLDIQDRVKYNDNTNEEGLLGLAFHPKYKSNGEVYVFYTPKKENRVNVVSRFKRSAADPMKIDPASEEQLYRFENRLFWNHDGGTIAFGPDGYLYIVHGDGGMGGDPKENAQNLGSPYGKILRIDVNSASNGKKYSVPADNPFVKSAGVLPEIWAYGIRNIWRMSFDRETGKLWAADVGQNLYEEINQIHKGGNYGWNQREAFHPFGPKAVGHNAKMHDPIWEYHHDLGKSITGGSVYRGSRLPELNGYYLYGDYVTMTLWALKLDPKTNRATANRTIANPGKAILSFGEDEPGDVYFLSVSDAAGRGIYRFTK
ncbi:PQQ-dependent sugar dehydrogenase [Tuwongella immobilis]|uniref:Glucose/Sorbosone dehydrogenase domain-containing protein n=1 Tax=Tuwongella immobilis TaxID=692036 RepID=A0A6C2YPK6_9BACT|nr:PQQ-dependent sugar dehydrogenase [Tuwongella immobilis]VIP03396.1 glucose sorbosone dehydrogenase-like protein : Glucose/sorbosone dehydrogenase OS=Singulisphaera acidiphila (strain ATCC BAA-1392 / DSM 18658 / VKM B-2454 / MOB10) GN=Sinac_6918 PE=4 SV=1: GSDH [Tuwongella immobilis]VTS04164.1 glucose sorbosone dehydrogenase-like protein : Glucose/sorbosone dehydrogenase OS=Singulisphaera acidiphila (strain ATCC BAA-1392 / DSM 18658 / VKM B-2454 / MOB10) GN=Sinac_6918 PE=4 SV=1: GSDH [Tuwongell